MYKRTVSITFRGREVQNPILRVLVGTIIAILAPFTLIYSVLLMILLIIASPALVVVHYILIACGRKGFVERSPDQFHIKVNADGFRKR